MFIQLDVSWVDHPFHSNNFQLTSTAQIDTLRGLGLKFVRYVPAKSVLQGVAIDESGLRPDQVPLEPAEAEAIVGSIPAQDNGDIFDAARDRELRLLAQHRVLAYCEQHFSAALAVFRQRY